MALKSVSSEEFSFPALASSQDSPHHPGLDSPPLWKHSAEKSFRQDHAKSFARLVMDDNNDLAKSFSYVERRSSLWSDKEKEKMDMLWEDLNEESTTRSQSLRIGEKKKTSSLSNESSAVAVGCGMKLSKKPLQDKKKSTNVLMLLRVLRKILVLRSSAQRSSPAKTHPR